MRKQIVRYLQELERLSKIKVLLAVESGSRSWGFPSADSDYDVRIIYMHHPEWYFHVSQHKHTIEYISDDRVFDLSGWELCKALLLMSKTNPGMTDWIFSDIIYQSDNEFLNDLQRANEEYYNPMRAAHHYASMARKFDLNTCQDQIITYKKYLYFLRAVLNTEFVLENEKRPPVRFQDLLGRLDVDSDIVSDILEIIERKSKTREKEECTIKKDLVEFAKNKYDEVIIDLQSFKPDWTFSSSGLKSLDQLAVKYINIKANE